MYVETIATALDEWVDGADQIDLVQHALTCRTAMLHSSRDATTNAYNALAAEVSYDRSLIKLSESLGIAAGVSNFSHPIEARRRSEAALADARRRSRHARAPTAQLSGGAFDAALHARGVDRCFGAITHIELVQQSGHVVLHGLLREIHRLGNLTIGKSLGDEVK